MRTYLQSHMSDLSEFGVKSVDDLLRAGRNGEPLKIVCGARAPTPDKPQYALAAYEQSSFDGRRLLCDSRGGVYEVSDNEFSEQFPEQFSSR